MPKLYNLRSIEVAELIEEYIVQHQLSAGDRLPAERELAEIYHVTRVTLRNALQDLIYSGKITRHKNKGYFVCGPKVRRDYTTYCFPQTDPFLDLSRYTTVPFDRIPQQTVYLGQNILGVFEDELYHEQYVEYIDALPVGITINMQKASDLAQFPGLFRSSGNPDITKHSQTLRLSFSDEVFQICLEPLALEETDNLLLLNSFLYHNDTIIGISQSFCVGTRVELITDIRIH